MASTLRAARAALFAILLGVCIGCDDTMTGPAATPTPAVPTPPPGLPQIVYVGQGQGGQRANAFVDAQSGTATSTIHAGQTIEWVWVNGSHSTTSGTCPLGCVTDGLWDSGIGHDTTYQHTFSSAGTFPYYCLVHGTMMQGTVIVQ